MALLTSSTKLLQNAQKKERKRPSNLLVRAPSNLLNVIRCFQSEVKNVVVFIVQSSAPVHQPPHAHTVTTGAKCERSEPAAVVSLLLLLLLLLLYCCCGLGPGFGHGQGWG